MALETGRQMQFSANLGFLWADRPLPDAVRAAAAAGFDAVECHWPYDTPVHDLRAALRETGLPLMGINTVRGDVAGGENGLCALPGREAEARGSIAQAVDYAAAVGARHVHVMAGRSTGEDARQVFADNLRHACALAAGHDIGILIEPLNPYDAPGYFLQTTDQARGLIAEVAAPNLRLMFDCYHVGRMGGDVIAQLADLGPVIGHIQFAAVPDRGAPDHGEVDYDAVFSAIDAMGWTAPVGAEYRPAGDTDASLGWLRRLKGA